MGEEDAVERADDGELGVAVGGDDQLVDQRIDALVGDAGIVLRTLLVDARRAEEEALLVARREGLVPARIDHVVVEAAQAVDVLRGVDHADFERDADLPEIGGQIGGDGLERGLVHQQLEGELVAIGIDEAGAIERVAGFAEERQGLAQVLAQLAGVAIDRIGEGRGEDAGRHEVLDLIEHGQFAPSGRPLEAKGRPKK